MTEIKSTQELIKEKLQSQVIALLPDDIWKKISDAAVDDLFAKKSYTRNPITGEQGNYSPLEQMVKEQLLIVVKEKVLEELKKPEWNPIKDGKLDIAPIIKEVLAENPEQFVKAYLTATIGGLMQDMIGGIQQNLRNSGIMMR